MARGLILLFAALLAVCASAFDDRRLLNAPTDGANWLAHGRDYSNRRYSPLNQINRENVQQLPPSWTV